MDRLYSSPKWMFKIFFEQITPLNLRPLLLVPEKISYSNPTYRSASSREPPRSTIGIAAVRTAIEYEYRCTEYRFAEYEYDEIRYDARTFHPQ
jgi:hypothetical protein